ncbi:hypothetical protein P8452_56259 [Trifolium repens]|nr:hypothetical protein P8452_56259 [Trifolium repens]
MAVAARVDDEYHTPITNNILKMNTYHVKFDCNSAVGKMPGLPMGCVHLRAAIEYQKKGPTENYEHIC